ncbi:hypothetical protein HPP92_025878 [Vanilla planifolia]|uniref:Protein kinase domain-containing protein n=1 Tax=Vanilla planifolia TaxID=51239 RepID=A0A835PHE2_VANPL|nr:hypothetical protein HPP92_025878 [Vanilla planifolia]
MLKLRNLCCASTIVDHEGSSCQSRASSGSNTEHPWEVFTLKQLINATNNFHENHKLGEGGFGAVYWGCTAGGGEIAVKRLKVLTAKAELEFAVEVEVLGRVRHRNLLGLRGYYAGGNERLIVYEYMHNRSLLGHLHGRRPHDVLLDWRQRLRIAFGSASGIAYLHHEAKPHIIHRDIKASNVLLDSKFRPKVADFGFAKLVPEGVSQMTTRVKGTLGYLAPEYAMWGKVSESCDVYSFGILLLEIVSGRRPIEKVAGAGGVRQDIVQWALPLAEGGKWDQIADPRLEGRFDAVQLRNVVVVAVRCTDACPENRPEMRKVMELLLAGIVGESRRVKEVEYWKGEPKVEKKGGDEADDVPTAITQPSFCVPANESTMMR